VRSRRNTVDVNSTVASAGTSDGANAYDIHRRHALVPRSSFDRWALLSESSLPMSVFTGSAYNMAALVVAVVALVAGIFGALYARRALSPPSRRLTLNALPPAPLLSTTSAPEAGIVVSHRGSPIIDPHVVTLSAENTGRHAVGSDQFDQGRPIKIDLGAPIKAILQVSTVPISEKDFVHKFEGSHVFLGPDLLNPGDSVVLQTLTEGTPSSASLRLRTDTYLKDTRVDFAQPDLRGPKSLPTLLLSRILATALAGGALAVLVILLLATLDNAPRVSVTPDNGPLGTQVEVSGSGFYKYSVLDITLADKPVTVFVTPTPDSALQYPQPASASPNRSPSIEASPIPTTSPVPQVPIAHVQTDAKGNFRVKFNIPDGYPKGPLDISIAGRVSEYSTSTETTTFFVR